MCLSVRTVRKLSSTQTHCVYVCVFYIGGILNGSPVLPAAIGRHPSGMIMTRDAPNEFSPVSAAALPVFALPALMDPIELRPGITQA